MENLQSPLSIFFIRIKCIISHSEVLGTLRLTPCITLLWDLRLTRLHPRQHLPGLQWSLLCSYCGVVETNQCPALSSFVLCKTALPERLPFTRNIWRHCETVNNCSSWWTHKQHHGRNSTERCRLICSLLLQGKMSSYTVVTVNWDCRSTGRVEITAGRRGWGLSRHSKLRNGSISLTWTDGDAS